MATSHAVTIHGANWEARRTTELMAVSRPDLRTVGTSRSAGAFLTFIDRMCLVLILEPTVRASLALSSTKPTVRYQQSRLESALTNPGQHTESAPLQRV